MRRKRRLAETVDSCFRKAPIFANWWLSIGAGLNEYWMTGTFRNRVGIASAGRDREEFWRDEHDRIASLRMRRSMHNFFVPFSKGQNGRSEDE